MPVTVNLIQIKYKFIELINNFTLTHSSFRDYGTSLIKLEKIESFQVEIKCFSLAVIAGTWIYNIV